MKRKHFTVIFMIFMMFIVLHIQSVVVAQSPPAFDEPWEPDVPPVLHAPTLEQPSLEQPSPVLRAQAGPIQPGRGFVAYYEDRFSTRRTEIYEDEMPVFLVVTLPPGLRDSWASCIQYYPPNYAIRNYLFRRINLGPSGTYRIGPFYHAPGEPYGRYAFRIGVLGVDAAGNIYWDEAVTFLEVKEREKTVTITVTQERTVTQVVTGVTVMFITQTVERTLTQPTIMTVEKPVFMTFEKTVTQTITATITAQALEATTIPIIILITVVIALLTVYFVYIIRMMKKK